MTTTKSLCGNFEAFQHGCSGLWGVRNVVTGTQTLRAMTKAAALRILRALEA